MKCRDFREIVDSYLSDELLTETNHDVLRHLEECADCRRLIESRRILRSQIKSAVLNAPEFQISEDFYKTLWTQLKTASNVEESSKNTFWLGNMSWLAFAASVIFVAGLGFWFFQPQSVPVIPLEVARNEEKTIEPTLAEFAVGDHQNCAVIFNLAERPIEIDIKEAKYADLRQGILEPLRSSDKKYEFLESHLCKYAGHQFTHIVFKHQGKTVSVLLTDLQNYAPLNNEEIAENFSNGYQIARFDIKNKAVFVVSNLSEQENAATAKILENPLSRQIVLHEQTVTESSNDKNFEGFQAVLLKY